MILKRLYGHSVSAIARALWLETAAPSDGNQYLGRLTIAGYPSEYWLVYKNSSWCTLYNFKVDDLNWTGSWGNPQDIPVELVVKQGFPVDFPTTQWWFLSLGSSPTAITPLSPELVHDSERMNFWPRFLMLNSGIYWMELGDNFVAIISSWICFA